MKELISLLQVSALAKTVEPSIQLQKEAAVQETPPFNAEKPLASEEGLARAAGYLTLIAGLNGGWLGPLIPSIATAQHLPLEQVGLIVSFLCGGCFVAQLLGPGLIAAQSSRKTLMLGSILLGLGMLALGLIPGLFAILTAAAVIGLGTGFNSIAGHVSILTYFRERAASALSKLNIFYGVGALAAPVIVQFSGASLGSGYSHLLACAAALTLFVLIGLLRLPPEKEKQEKNREQTETRSVAVVTLPLILTCLVIFLYVGAETATGTWLFTYIIDSQTKDTRLASLTVTALFSGLTIGRLISIKISSLFSAPRVTSTAMVLMVLGLFLLSSIKAAALPALLLTFAVGLGCGPIFPQMIAQASKLSPQQSLVPRVTAMAIGAGTIGGIIMPGAAGQVLARVGVSQTMLSIALLALSMLSLYLFTLVVASKRKGERKSEQV